jgi:hypothetical protein
MKLGDDGKPELWNDVLHRKHECYSVRDVEVRECRLEGRPVTYRISEYLPKFQACTGAVQGDLLFLYGSTEEIFDKEHCCAMLIGRRADDGIYDVHVWHELYPYARKYLGIESPPAPVAE